MKTKRVKLLTTLLSVGALSAILIPTIATTSCSAVVNPFVSKITSSVNINSKASTFEAKMANATMMETATLTLDGTPFDTNSFDNEWKKLKDKHSSLPSSIFQISGEIDQSIKSEVQALLDKKNKLTTVVTIVNNLKSIYENYDSLFISKNYNVAEIAKNSRFIKFFTGGLNNYKSYARLWLTDISFDVSVTYPTDVGTSKTKEELEQAKKTAIEATLTNVKLTYKWYEPWDGGSTLLDTMEKIKPFNDNLSGSDKLTQNDLSFSFTSTVDTKMYFETVYNTTNDKNVSTGLIIPVTSEPLGCVFKENDSQEQSRKKTDFFNKEVVNLLKEKWVTEENLNNLLGKVGYLISNDLPANNIIPDVEYRKPQFIKAGGEWVNKLMGGEKTTPNTPSKPSK